MKKIIECVPNISEGRDTIIIDKVIEVINSNKNVKLLNADPGSSTNRTVITFVGDPDNVINTAFEIIKKTQELIDMRNHKGEHPRMGATDVCPLIPISGITMEETIKYAHKLSKKVGEELNIPVYCYEYAPTLRAFHPVAFVRLSTDGLRQPPGRRQTVLPRWCRDLPLA